MAIGKNKRISKGKKGGKKVGDPFLKKEWYDLKAPLPFTHRNFGKTLVSKSQGTKLSIDGLKGRIFETNLADLSSDEDQGFRKIKLCCEDVQGRNCLTDFHGMDITRNHLCHLIHKWTSLIEAYTDVKTSDGYSLRLFCIAFTQKKKNQIKSTCYARSSQIRQIRHQMVTIMTQAAVKTSLKDLVQQFNLHEIERAILEATASIFPLQNIYIRKVKVLKKPKLDLTKLMELHGDVKGEDSGKTIIAESAAAENILAAEIQ